MSSSPAKVFFHCLLQISDSPVGLSALTTGLHLAASPLSHKDRAFLFAFGGFAVGFCLSMPLC